MRSRAALTAILKRSNPLVKNVEFTHYSYWRVTFSVAPGVDMSVMVCNPYIDGQTATDQALLTLRSITGQIVAEEL